MQRNVGKADKALRLVIAVALFAVGLTAPVGGGLRVLIFLFSAVALFTALFGF